MSKRDTYRELIREVRAADAALERARSVNKLRVPRQLVLHQLVSEVLARHSASCLDEPAEVEALQDDLVETLLAALESNAL